MINVWYIDLTKAQVPTSEDTLSSDEVERLSRIRHEVTRTRWFRSRVALRCILGHTVGCDPRDIQFNYGPYGKPSLAGAQGASPRWRFSLTRSGDLCAIAVSQKQLIGVDIERIAQVCDLDRIAGQLFGPAEMAILARLPDELRLRTFLAAWTQKEAYAKAIGLGLQISLQRLPRSIDLINQQTLAPVECENGAGWHMAALRPPEEFVGALALYCGYSYRRIRIFHRNYPAGTPATQSEICQRTELTPGATPDRTDGFACFWSRAHHVWRAFNRQEANIPMLSGVLGDILPDEG